MKWIITFILCGLLAQKTARGADIALHIGTHNMRAEIANTPHSRARGLMQHTALCKNCGMLFVFPRAGKHDFWMKDTPLPLSIAFIAADGSILNIAEMQANTTTIQSAQGNALFALEMNKNWFAEREIKPGDHVDGLGQALPGK